MSSLNTNSIPMFAGLPSAPGRSKAFASSFLVQAVGLALLVHVGLIQPAAFVHLHQYVHISLAPPPPVNHAPQHIPAELLTPKVRPVETQRVAKLEAPSPPKIDLP